MWNIWYSFTHGKLEYSFVSNYFDNLWLNLCITDLITLFKVNLVLNSKLLPSFPLITDLLLFFSWTDFYPLFMGNMTWFFTYWFNHLFKDKDFSLNDFWGILFFPFTLQFLTTLQLYKQHISFTILSNIIPIPLPFYIVWAHNFFIHTFAYFSSSHIVLKVFFYKVLLLFICCSLIGTLLDLYLLCLDYF